MALGRAASWTTRPSVRERYLTARNHNPSAREMIHQHAVFSSENSFIIFLKGLNHPFCRGVRRAFIATGKAVLTAFASPPAQVPNQMSAAIAIAQMATATAAFSAAVNGMMETLIKRSDLKQG
jgi:hypothetical protein